MRPVTDRDFRLPEFADAEPKDYEFRADGKLVRKDRWEKGIVRICGIVGLNVRSFEIDEVVQQVEAFVAAAAKETYPKPYGYFYTREQKFFSDEEAQSLFTTEELEGNDQLHVLYRLKEVS